MNLLRNENRRRELWQEHGPKGLQATHEAPEELMLMRTLLQEADEEQAKAAVYVYIDGMSQNEAAELLGVSAVPSATYWSGSMAGRAKECKKHQ